MTTKTSDTALIAHDGRLLCNCATWRHRRGTTPRHCAHTTQLADAHGGTVVPRGEFLFIVDVLDGDVDARDCDEDYPGQYVTGPDHDEADARDRRIFAAMKRALREGA